MNSFDIIIVIILVFFTIRGIFRGLIKEFLLLAALIFGFLAAILLLDISVQLLGNLFPSLPVFASKIIGFILIFVVINIITRIASALINKIITITFLQPINKIAGGIFAFFKISLILSLLLWGIDLLPFSDYVFRFLRAEESLFFHPIKEIAPFLFKVFSFLLPDQQNWNKIIPEMWQKVDSTIINPIKP